MKKILLPFFLMAFCLTLQSQSSVDNVWKTLSKITYKKQYDELMGFKIDIPVFSEPIKKLEKKEKMDTIFFKDIKATHSKC